MAASSREQTNRAIPAPIQLISAPSETSSLPDDAPHVLLVLDQFPAALGGGERIVLRLAKLLPQYGFRVSILTFLIDGKSPVLTLPAPCPIYLLPLVRTWDFQALRAARSLRRFLALQNVRIVQTFFESSDLWAGSVARTVPGVRLIWSRRDMGILRSGKHRAAYRMLSRMPDLVLAVSEQVRAQCIEVDGIAPERVQTLYNGVDLSGSTKRPPRRSGDSSVILAIGNVRRVKGYDVLLEAAALVGRSYPDVQFAVAGEVLEHEYFESLQRRCAELGLNERFYFLGGVTELGEKLNSASIFVLPSRSEGFSNAIVEAMAALLPVVATDVGGNAEAVEHGATGLIVPPEDAQALAGALCQLLEHPSEAEAMGRAGREKAEQKFSVSSMMEQLTAAYQKLRLR